MKCTSKLFFIIVKFSGSRIKRLEWTLIYIPISSCCKYLKVQGCYHGRIRVFQSTDEIKLFLLTPSSFFFCRGFSPTLLLLGPLFLVFLVGSQHEPLNCHCQTHGLKSAHYMLLLEQAMFLVHPPYQSWVFLPIEMPICLVSGPRLEHFLPLSFLDLETKLMLRNHRSIHLHCLDLDRYCDCFWSSTSRRRHRHHRLRHLHHPSSSSFETDWHAPPVVPKKETMVL